MIKKTVYWHRRLLRVRAWYLLVSWGIDRPPRASIAECAHHGSFDTGLDKLLLRARTELLAIKIRLNLVIPAAPQLPVPVNAIGERPILFSASTVAG
jgi:hypothetical protein